MASVKWEYLVVFIENPKAFPEDPIADQYADVDKYTEALNRYGLAGWELVDFSETDMGVKVVFKREKE